MFGKFSLDSLALAAFGVDAESFKNAESAFVKNASRILTNTFLDMALFFLKFIPGVPFLLGFFKTSATKGRPISSGRVNFKDARRGG